MQLASSHVTGRGTRAACIAGQPLIYHCMERSCLSFFHSREMARQTPSARAVARAFTVALTLLGLLLITFALSALHRSIAYYKSLAITPASPPMTGTPPVRIGSTVSRPVLALPMNLAHGDLGIASSTGQPVLQTCYQHSRRPLNWQRWRLLSGCCRRHCGCTLRPLCRFSAGFTVRTLTLLGNSVPVFWLGL